MPSHTFTRTGYWQDSIDSNIAAAAAARREGQTAEELHASDYEIYAYLQTGQDEAARRIVDSLPEIASRFDPKAVISGAGSPATGYFALAAGSSPICLQLSPATSRQPSSHAVLCDLASDIAATRKFIAAGCHVGRNPAEPIASVSKARSCESVRGCTETVSKPLPFRALELCLSEEQTPQVIVLIGSRQNEKSV